MLENQLDRKLELWIRTDQVLISTTKRLSIKEVFKYEF